MRERAYDLLATAGDSVGASRVQWRRRDAVVMYHAVRPAAECRPGTSDISRSRFRRDLSLFQSVGDVVPLAALTDPDPSRKRIAITFDDGYAAVHDHALPILRSFDAPATAFLVSGFLDGERPRERVMNTGHLYEPLSTEQVETLVEEPLTTIGNHTRTHHNLGAHHDRDIHEAEVLGARDDLESRFGIDVDQFSYPNGAYNDTSLGVVRESHDLAVVDESRRPLDGDEDPHLLPRVDGGLPFEQVRWRVSDANSVLMDLARRAGVA